MDQVKDQNLVSGEALVVGQVKVVREVGQTEMGQVAMVLDFVPMEVLSIMGQTAVQREMALELVRTEVGLAVGLVEVALEFVQTEVPLVVEDQAAVPAQAVKVKKDRKNRLNLRETF